MQRPVPTSMLKAVAEAASAPRTGTPVYVVANFDYPHERRVFFADVDGADAETEAREFLASRAPADDWMIFGPYVGEVEGPASALTPAQFRVTVQTTSADGEVSEETLDPRTDAVFLTLSAVDKFVMPYYTGVFGVERAAELRRRFVAQPEKWVHVLDSAWMIKK